MLILILFSELCLIVSWYLIHIFIVASSLPLLTEQSIFHTRSFGIDTYFPQWITWLLLQIVQVNWIDFNECTALHYACSWDDCDKVQLLISYGADPTVGQFTPLDWSILRANYDIIKILTHNGVLKKPFYTQNMDILRLLLQQGCDPNYFVDDACEYRHLAVLMLLIDYGADQSKLMGYDPLIDDYMIPTVKCTEFS